LWEAIEVLTGDDRSFLTTEGMALAEDIMTFMRDVVNSYTQETGKLFNLEATPAESAAYKLAKKALASFPDIPHRGLKKAPYFTNSCHLPVELQDRLDLVIYTQSKLQTIPNGGTVTHFYTGEDLSAGDIETFVKTICETPIPYFSVTTVYSLCPICGRVAGAWLECPNKHTVEQIEKLERSNPELVVTK
jgi:ribonucleoside-triphosphate reductase